MQLNKYPYSFVELHILVTWKREDEMKNIVLGFIVFLLLGIFSFLGIIVFTSDSSDETNEIEAEETVVAETSNEKDVTEEESSEEGNPPEENSKDEEKEEEAEEDKITDGNSEVEDEEPTESEATKIESDKDELNSLELENELSSQEVIIENMEYLIQDTQHKILYPDILSAIVKNNSETDIKNISYGFAAWDENGLPIRIEGNLSIGDGVYFYIAEGESVNIAPGEIHGKNYGLELDPDMDEIHSFKAIVTEYTGFNGENWKNPLLDDFSRMYEGKRLADIEGHEDTVVYRFESPSETNNVSSESNTSDSDISQSEVFITDYLYSLEEAYATGDFAIIESYLKPGSGAYNQMRDNVLNNNFPNLIVYSVEVVENTASGNNVYIEVLSDRINDNLDQIYEFRTGYNISVEDGFWMIEEFTDL